LHSDIRIFQIEVGVGLLLAALSSLGFLTYPIVGWGMIGIALLLMIHGIWAIVMKKQSDDEQIVIHTASNSSPAVTTTGDNSPVTIQGSFNSGRQTDISTILWVKRPGGPRFRLSPGVHRGKLLCTFQIDGTPAPGGVEAKWVGAGIDMDWATPMHENVPSGASYQKYQMKSVSMNPAPPQDEVAFEVRFYLEDGLHGGKWLWPLKQHPKGHWDLIANEGSGVFQPRLEDTW
jgi:hypothetical protein